MLAFIDKEKHWYVVRTNVKGEEKAFENIRKSGFDVYFPRRRVEIQNHRTHVYHTRENPLMPRYMFVGFYSRDYSFWRVNSLDGVESILGVNGRPIRVSADHIEAIHLAEVDMAFDDTRAARIHRQEEAISVKENTKRQFPAGSLVCIGEGPFASFGAIVEEITKTGKVVALIELFGRMTTVELNPKQICVV